jgi:hypothetical protein
VGLGEATGFGYYPPVSPQRGMSSGLTSEVLAGRLPAGGLAHVLLDILGR